MPKQHIIWEEGVYVMLNHRRKNKALELKFLLQAAHFDDELEQVL